MKQTYDTTQRDCSKNHRGASIRLGSWVCPSGNSVDVSITQDCAGRYHLWLSWDQPPPLLPGDRAYYFAVIQPEVTQLVQALTGLHGRVMTLMIE